MTSNSFSSSNDDFSSKVDGSSCEQRCWRRTFGGHSRCWSCMARSYCPPPTTISQNCERKQRQRSRSHRHQTSAQPESSLRSSSSLFACMCCCCSHRSCAAIISGSSPPSIASCATKAGGGGAPAIKSCAKLSPNASRTVSALLSKSHSAILTWPVNTARHCGHIV
jgi:hypothetical protein